MKGVHGKRSMERGVTTSNEAAVDKYVFLDDLVQGYQLLLYSLAFSFLVSYKQ
jgi:hypothetical protein